MTSQRLASIGVVIPCYESARFVRAAVESVIRQTLTPVGIVVVDDGSTDHPGAVLEDLLDGCAFLRIERQMNAGVSAARNRGAALLPDTDYVLFLDADDVLETTMLERLASVLDRREDAVMAWSGASCVNEAGAVIPKPAWPPGRRERRGWRAVPVPDLLPETSFASIFVVPNVNPSMALIRRRDFDAVGGFETSLVAYEDVDLFLRLRLRGEVLFLPDPLVRYRRHATQATAPESGALLWHQERALRDRWRALDTFEPLERAMVLDGWRFLDRQCVTAGAVSTLQTAWRGREPVLAARSVGGALRVVSRSLVRHRRNSRRA